MGKTGLTDTEIKKSKAKDKDYTLSDGNGLQLLVKTTESKLWEFRYTSPATGKRKKTSLGTYPTVTLKKAREKRNEFLKLIDDGVDPIELNKKQKFLKEIELNKSKFTIYNVSNEYFSLMQNNKSLKDKTITLSKNRLMNHYFSQLQKKENTLINDISFEKTNDILKKLEKSNKLETLSRVKQLIISIFKYAYAEGIIDNTNLSTKLELKVFKKNLSVKNNATLTKESDIKELYLKILTYNANIITKYLVLMSVHTAQRQNSIIQAKWKDIDFNKKIWFIPKQNMKGQDHKVSDHHVPISNILKDFLLELKDLTGDREYLFPNFQLSASRNRNEYISNNTTRMALRRMGYSNEELTAHGLRAMFKTVCKEYQEEHNLNNEFVERVLAHKVDGDVESVYNRAKNIDDMRKILDWWSSYLHSLTLKAD